MDTGEQKDTYEPLVQERDRDTEKESLHCVRDG